MCPEEKRAAEPVRRTATHAQRHDGQRAQHVRHRLQVRRPGLHDGLRRGHSAPLAARHAHEEFADTPCIDKGFYVLMGNNHYIMRAIQQREPEKAEGASSAGCCRRAEGLRRQARQSRRRRGLEAAAGGQRHATSTTSVDHFDVTPRQIIAAVARAVDELRLPHPVHIHANNLGLPGNWTTTLETMKLLEGHRGHLTHIQFHSYGGGDGDEDTFSSKVAPLAEYVNEHPEPHGRRRPGRCSARRRA